MTAPAGTDPADRGAADSGIATVWAAIAVAALVAVLAAMLGLVAAVGGRHRAEAAADLAALAAAAQAVRGEAVACGRAAQVATGTGGRLVLCRVRGGEAVVEVEVALRVAVLGGVTARSRARAGPADPPLMPPSAPLGDTRVIPRQRVSEPPEHAEAHARFQFLSHSRRAVGRQQPSGRRPEARRPPAETITCSDVGAPGARVHRRHQADRRPSLAWRAVTGPTGTCSTVRLTPDLRPRCRSPVCGGVGASPGRPTPDRLHRAAAAAGRLGPRRAGRRRPKPSGRDAGSPAGARRRARRPARSPHPPCPAGRCRCRTWATARTTGSRRGTRSRRSPPGSRPARRASTACPRSANPAPPGWPSWTKTVGQPVCGCTPSTSRRCPSGRRSRTAAAARSPRARRRAARPGSAPATARRASRAVVVDVVPDRAGAQLSARACPAARSPARPRPGSAAGSRPPAWSPSTSPNDTRTAPWSRCSATRDHRDVRASTRASVRQSGVGGVHQGEPGVQIQVVDDVALAAVQVDRAGVDARRRGRARRRCPASGRCRPRPRPPGRCPAPRMSTAPAGRCADDGQNQPRGPAAQHPVGHQLVQHRLRRRAAEHVATSASVSGSSAAAQASCGAST